MIRFIETDGGRQRAGFRGRTGDCVVRAVTIISGEQYKNVYRTAAAINKDITGKRSARNGLLPKVYNRLLARFGFVKVNAKRPSGDYMTYSEAWERYGNCIVSTNKHLAAIMNGALQDTFDGRTYEWPDESGMQCEIRERKARSIWVPA